MKKFFFLFLIIFLSFNFSISQELNTKPCDKCNIEDDEYCIYNECYFNKHYRNLKKILCLTQKQEMQMDLIYNSFKEDMENFSTLYRTDKNQILEQIECGEEFNEYCLKEIKKNMKDRTRCFKKDVEDILSRNQYKIFKKELKKEKKIFKKLLEYSKIYKFPCSNCEQNCKS